MNVLESGDWTRLSESIGDSSLPAFSCEGLVPYLPPKNEREVFFDCIQQTLAVTGGAFVTTDISFRKQRNRISAASPIRKRLLEAIRVITEGRNVAENAFESYDEASTILARHNLTAQWVRQADVIPLRALRSPAISAREELGLNEVWVIRRRS